MLHLVLLLLVGTICAQEPGDYLHNNDDDDDDNKLVDLSDQQNEDAEPNDVETTPFDDFKLEDDSGDALHNDTDEVDDLSSEEDDEDKPTDLKANSEDHGLQPDATMKIVDEKTKIFGVLRIFTRVVRTFFRAENVCRRLHGDLSSIHGRRISARMRRMMKKRGGKKLAWIGVWRPWRSGKYQNVDQTPMDYSRFGRGQCKKRGRWCVAMNMQTGRWTSQNCNRKLPFVCKSCQRP